MRRFPALARDPGITHLCTNTGRRGGGAFSKGTIPAGSAGKLPALTGIIPQPAIPRFFGRERILARPRKKKGSQIKAEISAAEAAGSQRDRIQAARKWKKGRKKYPNTPGISRSQRLWKTPAPLKEEPGNSSPRTDAHSQIIPSWMGTIPSPPGNGRLSRSASQKSAAPGRRFPKVGRVGDSRGMERAQLLNS